MAFVCQSPPSPTPSGQFFLGREGGILPKLACSFWKPLRCVLESRPTPGSGILVAVLQVDKVSVMPETHELILEQQLLDVLLFLR